MGERLPSRQNLRLKGLDYSAPGFYFVTLCTRERREVFGTIVNGRVVLNACGKIADACWRDIPKHFPSVRVDEHVVMPNHVHGVIGAYKSAVSRILGRQLPTTQWPARAIPAGGSALWHRNYWDVVVRNSKALAAIRTYIRQNPQNYQAVMNCGEPKWLGDRMLLNRPKLGFAASRGKGSPHGLLSLRPGLEIVYL